MGSLSSKSKSVKYLLCTMDVFIKYAWAKPLNNKKGKTFFHDFVEIVNVGQISYGLIKEENFIMVLRKNG